MTTVTAGDQREGVVRRYPMIAAFARSAGPLTALFGQCALLLLRKASVMLYMIHQLLIRYAVLALGEMHAVHFAAAARAVPQIRAAAVRLPPS